MPTSPVATAHRLVTEAVDALTAAVDGGATDAELAVGAHPQRGHSPAVGSAHRGRGRRRWSGRVGSPNAATRLPAAALGDLLGWERFEARRRVTAAEQVQPRHTLDGTALPARLPATAEVFAAGQAGLRHVEVIAKVLATPAAGRLSPEVWGGAEAELAAKASSSRPPNCGRGAPP